MSFDEFVKSTYGYFLKTFKDVFVVQFSKNTAYAERNTFVIRDKIEFVNLKKLIEKQEYRHEEIDTVDVLPYIEGKVVSLNCCIAKSNLFLGNPSLQIIDLSDVYNLNSKYKNKRCGFVFGSENLDNNERKIILEKAREIGKKIIKYSSYKGIFSLEFIISKNKDIVPIGCKTHVTSSGVIEDLIRISHNKIPMEAFQVLESFCIDYDYKEEEIDYKFNKNKKYSVIYLYNVTNRQININKHINSGIYSFDVHGKIKYKKESILPKDFEDEKNEFMLVESITEKDKYVEVQDSDTKIMSLVFPQITVDKEGKLKSRIKKVISKIYRKLGI